MDEIEFWNNYLYTDQKTIISELNSRKNNPDLKKAVQQFWGDLLPDFLDEDNFRGFFARPIVTPNMETRFFIDIVNDFKIKPLFMEFPDKFATVNRSKYHLAKPHFSYISRKGIRCVEKRGIVDFNKWEGAPLTDIETLDGKNLAGFHRELFLNSFPEHKENIRDISIWFDRVRHGYGEFYYLGFLALGIYNGVIFENFILNDERELQFFLEKVAPSFREIERIFGVKPLISPVLPLSNAKLDEWYYYPKNK